MVGGDDTHVADVKILLRRALARLTARQRAVLVLRYFEDLPEAEVAAMAAEVARADATHAQELRDLEQARLRAATSQAADLDHRLRKAELELELRRREADARERAGPRRYHATRNDVERSMSSLGWTAEWRD